MKKSNLLSIALALMYLSASAQTSLRQLKAEEDTLQAYFMKIVNAAYPVEKECIVEYGLKYNVPAAKANKQSYYVKERERRKVCYDYLYRDSILTRVRCKLEIDSIYRDSINTLLIPVKGNRISGDNISLALMLRKYLKLDAAQYDYLMDKALKLINTGIFGMTSSKWFFDEYNAYRGQYVKGNAVLISDADAFIRRIVNIENVDLNTAIKNNYSFLMFVRPLKNEACSFSLYGEDYLYVFNDSY